MFQKVALVAAILTLATTVIVVAQTEKPKPRVGVPLAFNSSNSNSSFNSSKDAMEVPDWQDWFSPLWLEEHKDDEDIGHGYRQFRAGADNAGAISMGYKFADGQGVAII